MPFLLVFSNLYQLLWSDFRFNTSSPPLNSLFIFLPSFLKDGNSISICSMIIFSMPSIYLNSTEDCLSYSAIDHWPLIILNLCIHFLFFFLFCWPWFLWAMLASPTRAIYLLPSYIYPISPQSVFLATGKRDTV